MRLSKPQVFGWQLLQMPISPCLRHTPQIVKVTTERQIVSRFPSTSQNFSETPWLFRNDPQTFTLNTGTMSEKRMKRRDRPYACQLPQVCLVSVVSVCQHPQVHKTKKLKEMSDLRHGPCAVISLGWAPTDVGTQIAHS